MKRLALFAALLPCGCAGVSNLLPHARFEVGFMGAEVALDTRPLVNTVAGAFTAGTAGAVTAAGITQTK